MIRAAYILVVMTLGASTVMAATVKTTGEVRARHEVRVDYDFDRSRGDQNSFTLLRTRVNMDVEISQHGSAFIQLQDSRVLGEPASTTTSLEQVDMHQAYIQLGLSAVQGLRLRIGRQQMALGAQRLVGSLGWSNVGRAFDGVTAHLELDPHGWVLGFAHMLAESAALAPGDLDGILTDGREGGFLGLVGHLDLDEHNSVEAYLLDRITKTERGSPGDRTGSLVTAGARVELTTPDGRLQIEGEGAYQFGSMPDAVMPGDGPSIRAWAGVLRTQYEAPIPTRPWAALEWNIASGDDGSRTDRVTTFDQLFPTGHGVLGTIDFVGWRNIQALQGTVGFHPRDDLRVWASGHYFAILEQADAWYGANGRPRLAGSSDFDNELGTEIDLAARWTPESGLSFDLIYGVWLPGRWHQQATSGSVSDPASLEAAHFVTTMATARF